MMVGSLSSRLSSLPQRWILSLLKLVRTKDKFLISRHEWRHDQLLGVKIFKILCIFLSYNGKAVATLSWTSVPFVRRLYWRQIRSHGLSARHSRHPGLSDFTRRAAAGYWGMIEWLELRIPIKVLKRNYLRERLGFNICLCYEALISVFFKYGGSNFVQNSSNIY